MAITATGLEVWVGGYSLHSVAPGWGAVKVTDRWAIGTGGGNWEMSWTVPVGTLRRHQALTVGQPVVARYGGSPRFAGFMSEPNWDTGEMVALGNVRRGEEALCFDGSGLTNTIPDTVVDAAIARGALPWIRRASIGTTAVGESTLSDNLNYVSALLNAYTLQAGVGWGVNARGEVYSAALPTVPTLSVMPDSGVLGVADQALAGKVFGRYQATGAGLATATAGTGTPEVGLSFLKRGAMSSTDANALAAGILAKLGTVTSWTNGLTLAAEQITNPGGAKINLASVVADGRTMVSLQGVRDVRGLGASTSFVVGESIWDVTDRTVQVNPIGLVDRSLSGIASDFGVDVA